MVDLLKEIWYNKKFNYAQYIEAYQKIKCVKI